jgi:hypothetical protein
MADSFVCQPMEFPTAMLQWRCSAEKTHGPLSNKSGEYCQEQKATTPRGAVAVAGFFVSGRSQD